MGSPAYMAPEQWENADQVDQRCDIYALGVLAYEAIAGRRPFTGSTIDLAIKHRSAAIPPLPEGVPVALNAVLARAMAKEPVGRHASALEFAQDVRRASGISAKAVIEGTLADFDFEALLQVVSASRQQTSLDVFDSVGRIRGVVLAKAGRILSASAEGRDGDAAVRLLMEAPATSYFTIARVPDTVSAETPVLGLVSEVLRRVSIAEPTDGGLPPPEQTPAAPPPRPRARMALSAGALAMAVMALVWFIRSSPPKDASPSEAIRTEDTHVAVAALRPGPTTANSPESVAPPLPSAPPVALTPPPAGARGALEPTPTVPAQPASAPIDVRALQGKLKEMGHDPGPIDGVFGPRTRGALRAFQLAGHLPADGTMNQATRGALGEATR
jgi:serine/threonine protein kinase